MLNTTHSHLVCCYCDREMDLEARVCYYCGEYKGVMTVEAFEDYLGIVYDCDCNE